MKGPSEGDLLTTVSYPQVLKELALSEAVGDLVCPLTEPTKLVERDSFPMEDYPNLMEATEPFIRWLEVGQTLTAALC
jgi:hypothetical protein